MAVIGATAGAEMEAQISKLTVQKDTPSTTCVFLSIARELRDMIYGHLLEITPAEHCYPDGPAKRYSLPSLAILATNKQIRDEAQVVYDKVNEIVSIETSIEIATMDEPRPIGFLNTRIGQAAEDSARRFKRLAELLDEAHLPRLKIMSTSASSAGHEKKPSNFLLMLEDLPDLMLGLYLYEVMDEMNVRDKASIQELEFKWELPQGTKALSGARVGSLMECLNTNSPPVGVHDFASFGVKSGQKLQRSASNPTFRRPAFPLAEVACLDGEASALYWDERDCSSAIAVWRHAMSYLDVYAYESNHCGVMLDDGEFPDYAELRFNIGLQVATAVFVEMDASGGFDTNERDCKKKHNDRCNLAIAHLARAGSMLCTELFDAGAEARLCFLYAKMSSMIWPANVREAAAAIEQACALDPGVPSYEKEHDDIYVISYATETGNLDAVHEQEEDQASPQWTIIDRPNHAVPGPGYTAYRYLPKDIGASLRAELANSEGDEIS